MSTVGGGGGDGGARKMEGERKRKRIERIVLRGNFVLFFVFVQEAIIYRVVSPISAGDAAPHCL